MCAVHVNLHFVDFPRVNGDLDRLKKQYPNPASTSLAYEGKQSYRGVSGLKVPALHGAGDGWLPTLEKLLLNQLYARGKKGKVSCGASRDEGKTFRSWFLESSYKMQFGDNPKAVMARRYLLLNLIRVRGMFAKLFAAVLHCLSFYEQSL